MDNFADGSTCRICLKNQDIVYSLFCKQKGIYPYEKLKKIGIKVDAKDASPQCICCDCLMELNVTLSFLEKCEKSNQILAPQLPRSEQSTTFKDDVNIGHENNAYYPENNPVDIDLDTNTDSITEKLVNGNNDIALGWEEARCGECGSKRRCQHWAPPTTHTCPYCQKVFTRKFNFKLHLARHSGSGTWWCTICGARAASRWLAASHCAPRRRRACPVAGCGKTYTTNTNLNTHLRVHTGERPFECSECGKKFTSKNTLSDHMRIHTGALPYVCAVCGARFRTNKLAAHLATHEGARLACPRPGCTRRFASRRALERHRAAQHGAQHAEAPGRAAPAHACGACPARYRHRQSLNKHVRKQHQQKPLPADIERNDQAKETQSDM